MNKPTSSFYRGPIWLNHGLAKCSPFTAMLLLIGVVFVAEEKNFIPDRPVTYETASEFELQLHIFNPHGHAATDQRPAIVFFFGGGWSGGTPKQFYQQAREVADLGMVAIPADYRVKSRNKTSPVESVADAKSAIRWGDSMPKNWGSIRTRLSGPVVRRAGMSPPARVSLKAMRKQGRTSRSTGVLAWFEGRYAKVPPTMFAKKKPNELNPGDYRIMPPYEPALKKGLMEVAPDFVDGECLTRFTDKAIEWINGRVASKDGKPFFLYLPYTSPHLPVIPLERFRGKSGCGAYGDFMMETDWHVGRLLDTLEAAGLTRDTLIIFSSDNGPENPWEKRITEYDHFSSGVYRDGKRSIYDGGHRVPFIARWPAKVKAGVVVDQPVGQIDLLATFAEIVGAGLPDDAGEDSVSFYPLLTGATQAPERTAMIHHASNGRFAIREGWWKLIMEHARDERELYDMRADPGEKKTSSPSTRISPLDSPNALVLSCSMAAPRPEPCRPTTLGGGPISRGSRAKNPPTRAGRSARNRPHPRTHENHDPPAHRIHSWPGASPCRR